MRLQDSLDDAFATRSHVRILRTLFALPDGFAVSARDAARRAGISHPRASAALRAFADQGLLQTRRVPRADLFSLNPTHLLTVRLKDLFAWERRVPDALVSFLRQQIRRNVSYASAAFLFGSAARGTMTPTSDVDLAIICPAGKVDSAVDAMQRVADDVRDRFGNRLSVIVGTPSAAPGRKRERVGYRLWRQVAREGIPLLRGAKRWEA